MGRQKRVQKVQTRMKKLSGPIWRRARKEYVCNSCELGILAKGLYTREVWVIDRRIHVDRTHFPCCEHEIDALFEGKGRRS